MVGMGWVVQSEDIWSLPGPDQGTFNNPRLIYYGIPPDPLLDRSSLSTNKPKNGSGDSRECAINGCSNAQAIAGDPIDTRTGNFDYSLVDLSLQTVAGPLTFQRSYASLATDTNLYPTDMGPGWTHNQDSRLIIDSGVIWFKGQTLNQYQFTINANPPSYTPYPGVLASLSFDSSNSTYTLIASDQSKYTFDSSGQMVSWKNELDYGFSYSYSNNKLYRVTELKSGRYLQVNYQSGHLSSVNDSANPPRTVSFGYNGNGDLTSLTDVRGKTWTYGYDGTSHHLNILKDPSTPAKTILTIHYDPQGRADEQFNGKGERIVKIIYNGDGISTLLDALGRQATDGYDGRNTNTVQIDSAGYSTQKSFDANFRPSQVTDQNNRSLQYQWSADGANLTYIKDASGSETHLHYNDQNHLDQVIDPRGQVMTYSYMGSLLNSTTRQTSTGNIVTFYTYTTAADAPQPENLLKTITDALGHVTTFTYDTKGQLSSTKDADNKVTTLAYDDLGRVTDVTNPLLQVTHTIYDPAGNITHVIQNYDTNKAKNELNLYNLTTDFAYDDLGRLYQTTNTLGFTTGTTYDDAGRVYQVMDSYGKATTSLYNAAGQVTTVTDPLGHSTGYEYDSVGRVWKVKDALDRVILTYAYNPDSTIHSETRPTAVGDAIVTYDSYDALKRPTRISDNTDIINHWSEATYDPYGNPLTRTDALGRVTKYEYNDLGLLSKVVQNYKADPGVCDYSINPNGPNDTNLCTVYTYDNLGNLKKIKDANAHETTFDYDVLNRLWKVTNPLGKVTEFGYDALGNRTSVKDAKTITTTFIYDLASRLKTIDYPTGMTDVVFTYDALGRLTGMDDSLGHTTKVYDNLNRITSITDPFNKTVGYGYDDDGKRTSITYPSPVSKTIIYQYNPLDQLEHVLDGATHLADYAYDVAGRVSGETFASGINSTPGYDRSGQLTSLTYQKGATSYASYIYHYNAVGNRDQVQETLYYPSFAFVPAIMNSDAGGGQAQAQGAFPLNPNLPSGSSAYPAPLSNSAQPNNGGINPGAPENAYPAPGANPTGSETSLLQRGWDFLVNLFSDHTLVVSAHSDFNDAYPAPSSGGENSAPASAQTIDYGYDALNRLTSATYATGSSYAYGFDKVGNRTSQTVGGATTTNQYDAADRLTSANGVAYSWDDNGNLLSDGVNSYSYDFANRLTGVTQGTNSFAFNYDGLDNRYRQTVNGQSTTDTLDLAGGLSQVLYDGAYSYYYGLGRISQQKNGVTETFLPDGLGSVRQLADQNGSVIFGQAFDPFGNSIGQSGLGGSSYGFAGEWTDGTGLQNLRARYYSLAQGRFLTKDSFSGFSDQPSTLNAYAYATNNPVLMSDPTGHFAWLPVFVIGGAIIGAAVNFGNQVFNNYQSNKCNLGAAFTQNINFSAVLESALAGAALGFSVAVLAPVAIGVAGEALTGIGLLTGSTSIFSAGLSAYEISASVGAAIYGLNKVSDLASTSSPSFSSQMEDSEAERYENYWTNGPSFSSQMEPDEARSYNQTWEKRAPVQSTPYGTNTRYNPDGSIHQVTTYDQFGNRYNQYDLDDARFGEHYHPYYNNGTNGASGLGPRETDHISLDEVIPR
jgi:RHS repeat-associated protein